MPADYTHDQIARQLDERKDHVESFQEWIDEGIEPAPGPGFIAALATEDSDGPYCDITVLLTGDDGDLTDRQATDHLRLAAALLEDPDRLAKAQDAAPAALAGVGWRLAGPWHVAANAAYAPVQPMPHLTVSIAEIAGGALARMPAVTGIYWTDTDYTECRAHLSGQAAGPVDVPDVPGGLDAKVGVILTGPVTCDACRERVS